MTSTNAIIYLITIPIVASPLIYLIGRITLPRHKNKTVNSPSRWLAFLAMLADGVPLYFVIRHFLTDGTLQLTINAIQLEIDGIALIMAVSVWLLGLMVMIFSAKYMSNELNEEKYYALLCAMVGTIIGLGSAADLFNLWVWFEAMAITSYMLVAFYRSQPASLEAGVKYLVQSAAGSSLVLLGIALTFMATGTTTLSEIKTAASASPILLASGALFLIGFGVKTALVPLSAPN